MHHTPSSSCHFSLIILPYCKRSAEIVIGIILGCRCCGCFAQHHPSILHVSAVILGHPGSSWSHPGVILGHLGSSCTENPSAIILVSSWASGKKAYLWSHHLGTLLGGVKRCAQSSWYHPGSVGTKGVKNEENPILNYPCSNILGDQDESSYCSLPCLFVVP